jgi:DNA-binding transcriptional regulator YdaS (Cro superfamily)
MNTKSSGLVRAIIHFGGSQSALARAIGTRQSAISRALRRGGTMSARNAIQIERVTGGKVRRHEICPDLEEPATCD